MALLDPAAQDASLNMSYGAGKGASACATHLVALYDDDPANGGTEITGGGYARKSVTNNGTNWPGASGGSTLSAVQTFATSSGAWSTTARWFCLIDNADGVTRWDSGRLSEEINVTTAGQIVKVRLRVNYEDVI